MKYQSDEDFRRALEDRLRQREKERGEPLVRLRKRLAFERCSVRLQRKNPNLWILKGGVALELRLEQRARMTRDLDLAMDLGLHGNQELAYSDLAQMLRQDLTEAGDDHFVVLVHENNERDTISPGIKAYRFTVEVRLAGRTFEKIRVDIGVGDPLIPPFDELVGSDLLSFDGIPRPVIRSTSRAQHFAEKVHALTRPLDDRINTRVKDLVDIMLLMDLGLPKPPVLKDTVEKIFAARQTHSIPGTIGNPPATWVSSFTAMAIDIGLTETRLENAASRLNNYWSKIFKFR
ncbi:MAG: nucleotidyl transferase AbiEii/AbiGii toxin family protein [bacterium]